MQPLCEECSMMDLVYPPHEVKISKKEAKESHLGFRI
jgi:hypothetical protein